MSNKPHQRPAKLKPRTNLANGESLFERVLDDGTSDSDQPPGPRRMGIPIPQSPRPPVAGPVEVLVDDEHELSEALAAATEAGDEHAMAQLLAQAGASLTAGREAGTVNWEGRTPGGERLRVIGQAREQVPDQWPDEPGAQAPDWYTTLFGPLAVAATPEQRHLAAWELYCEHDALLGMLAELQTSEEPEGLVPRLLALHSDNGHGWCTGCGQNDNGGFSTRAQDCPTVAVLIELRDEADDDAGGGDEGE